jgi:aspartyl-tRNA(Asn)/glutamyl-tRNA(Gln) amidotransferase subunit C
VSPGGLSRDDVDHVARLARLALTDADSARMLDQLSSILRYIDKLRELDTEGVPPTSHAVPLENVMRDDVVEPCLPQADMLANAPDRVDDFFRVPRIIED